MRTRTKICCIATVAEAEAAIRSGADALGLVGQMPSGPGQLRDEEIREIASQVPPGVDSFLLTSETEAAAVVSHVLRCRTSVVQLVDDVSEDTYQAVREACPNLRIVQVLHVEDDGALTAAHQIATAVDAILLDSGRPSAETPTLGGTGDTHDWSISARIVKEVAVPVFLAGGLNPENVGEAIKTVRPYGVDLCSGIRTDGDLDFELLKSFMNSVRETGAS